jgi:Rod binding domain-containing protein
MDIQIKAANINNTNAPKAHHSEKKKEKVATAFEKIFARQLIEQMTKGLFKHDDKGIMEAGNSLYRTHIVDTLAQELASQHKLGIGEMVMNYFNQKSDNNKEG